jgi:RNA polymerase sigma-70 factor (ECF subfamily)
MLPDAGERIETCAEIHLSLLRPICGYIDDDNRFPISLFRKEQVCMPGLMRYSVGEPSQDEESALLEAAQKKPEAFAALYDRYVQPVYRYLYSRTGSAAEAEDLTAQTFLQTIESLPRYDHRGRFSAWLFSIARARAADYHRRRKPLPLEGAEQHPADTDILGEVVRDDQIRRLAERIRSLPEEERELIRLHFTADLTFAEMASLLGEKEDTVKKRLYRLLARLQGELE